MNYLTLTLREVPFPGSGQLIIHDLVAFFAMWPVSSWPKAPKLRNHTWKSRRMNVSS